MRPHPTSDKERFDGKWKLDPSSGCWLWTASKDSDGYGQFWQKGHLPKAHRAAWRLYRGPIPEGAQIDHLCRVRHCVNPDHLRLVTLVQNVLENSASITAKIVASTHCPKCGSLLIAAPKGMGRWQSRYCKPCYQVRTRRYRQAKRNRRSQNA